MARRRIHVQTLASRPWRAVRLSLVFRGTQKLFACPLHSNCRSFSPPSLRPVTHFLSSSQPLALCEALLQEPSTSKPNSEGRAVLPCFQHRRPAAASADSPRVSSGNHDPTTGCQRHSLVSTPKQQPERFRTASTLRCLCPTLTVVPGVNTRLLFHFTRPTASLAPTSTLVHHRARSRTIAATTILDLASA